jgi:hypothetical protein
VIIISLPSKVGLTPQSRLHLADPLQRVALLYNFYKHFEQILDHTTAKRSIDATPMGNDAQL